MFDMTAPNSTKPSVKSKSIPNQAANNYYVGDNGQGKDLWFKEEEMMRKKLEKGAIAQLKSRIAQQNRAAGTNKNIHVEPI
jgi:hypothetical protein